MTGRLLTSTTALLLTAATIGAAVGEEADGSNLVVPQMMEGEVVSLTID